MLVKMSLQWLSSVLRRQGQLAPGDEVSNAGVPLVTPRPGVVKNEIGIQSSQKASPVKGRNAATSMRTNDVSSISAIKSFKMEARSTPLKNHLGPAQVVDDKLLQMATHAASLRPATTRSGIDVRDTDTPVHREAALDKNNLKLRQASDETISHKSMPPPLPPHAMPPPHAHRKAMVRNQEHNNGV